LLETKYAQTHQFYSFPEVQLAHTVVDDGHPEAALCLAEGSQPVAVDNRREVQAGNCWVDILDNRLEEGADSHLEEDIRREDNRILVVDMPHAVVDNLPVDNQPAGTRRVGSHWAGSQRADSQHMAGIRLVVDTLQEDILVQAVVHQMEDGWTAVDAVWFCHLLRRRLLQMTSFGG
jgi:hypothetical protein